MTSELTSTEKAVLRAILKQRKAREFSDARKMEMLSNPDIFIYDIKEGQLFIDGLKIFQKYEVGYAEQLKVIRDLAKREIIRADWVVNSGTADEPKYVLANNSDWVKNKFYGDEFLSDYYKADMENTYYINLSMNEIKVIFDKYLRKYKARLFIDCACLIVTCDNEKYRLPCLHEDERPYVIISFAMEHLGKKISKEAVNKKLERENEDRDEGDRYSTIGDKVTFAKVFERNTTIRETLSPFIELKSKYMRIVEEAELSSEQLTLIKEASQRFRNS